MEKEEFEEICKTLGEIQSHYPPGSREAEAIQRALEASLFAFGEKVRIRFVDFLRRMKDGLTPAQEAHLRSMGIDPDAVDDE